ncbi:MAG: alcohol dehydrogenase catalytic domain-containing protein [bacterium]
MRAIVNTGPGNVAWTDCPTPAPAAGQVRIRTAACGVCATDLEMIAGWSRTGFPSIPGHEWAGVVDEVGPGVEPGLIGQPCVGENVLADGGEVGFEHPGGYGQYFLTEARNLHLLPSGFALPTAVLIEPLAVCVRALRRLRLERQQPVLILGDGTIGLLTLLLLRARSTEEIVLAGGRPGRLELARQLGASRAINYHEAGAELARAIGGPDQRRYPNVIEASGSRSGMQAALDVATQEGKILIIGDYGSARADLLWNDVLHRELELIGSNASAGAWPETMRLATSGQLPLERLVSRQIKAVSFETALDLARHSRDTVKVVLDWTE